MYVTVDFTFWYLHLIIKTTVQSDTTVNAKANPSLLAFRNKSLLEILQKIGKSQPLKSFTDFNNN